MMETYFGYVRTPADAIKLFEACRVGLLPRVQRRLSEKERMSIRSGSVYVWDEREAGMRRWTDGKSWSASRVSGSFLTYREMEGKRGGGFGTSRRGSGKTPDSGRASDDDQDDGEPDGYRYKVDGLMKQSFSITTSTGQHLHLIAYYSRPHAGEPEMLLPSTDPALRQIVPAKGMYPESSMNESPMQPATSRAPLQQVAYVQQGPPPPHGQPYPPHYVQAGYTWPPSPVATPPYSHYTVVAYPHPQAQPLFSPHHPPHYAQPPPPPQHNGVPPQAYEHRPALPSPHAAAGLPRAGDSRYVLHPRAHEVAPHAMQSRSAEMESPRSHHLHAQATQAAQALIDPRLGPPPMALRFAGRGPSLPALTPMNTSTDAPPLGTPPLRRGASVSPPHSSHSDLNGNSPSANHALGPTNKASLSALLHHPTPTNSEPSSANPASVSSANSSPRTGAGPPPPALSQQQAVAAQLAAAQAQSHAASQSKRAIPFNEDARALGVLDKKLCL